MGSTLSQLQLLQQNLQSLLSQKQQIENQLTEINSAITETQGTDKVYKIIAGIMVAVPPEKAARELKEKKDFFQIRLKNFNGQEERLKQNIEKIQQEVIEELKNKKK